MHSEHSKRSRALLTQMDDALDRLIEVLKKEGGPTALPAIEALNGVSKSICKAQFVLGDSFVPKQSSSLQSTR